MSYLGSWKIDDYLTFCCNTHDPDTGVATDADAVPAYRVYEDETAAAIVTGNMALLDDANTVGFYSEQIQLTAANGFEKGKCYTIYISATVDGDAGTMNHSFQMEAEVDANTVSGTVTPAASSITASVLAGDCITSNELSASALAEIADVVLKRGVSNVEDGADMDSLTSLILSKLHAEISGTTLTIYKVDDITTFDTKAVVKSASADPITSVKDP